MNDGYTVGSVNSDSQDVENEFGESFGTEMKLTTGKIGASTHFEKVFNV